MDKLIIIYCITNAASFLAFGIDKRKAKKGCWRIPEKTLLLMGAVGGIGQLAGMKLFRHKTQKWYFNVTGYLFTVMQIGWIVLLFIKGIA